MWRPVSNRPKRQVENLPPQKRKRRRRKETYGLGVPSRSSLGLRQVSDFAASSLPFALFPGCLARRGPWSPSASRISGPRDSTSAWSTAGNVVVAHSVCRNLVRFAVTAHGVCLLRCRPDRLPSIPRGVKRPPVIDSFVGVGSEKIALGLDQVGRQAGAAVGVVVGQRCHQAGGGKAQVRGRANRGA